ncbi:MAG: S41 family peptidase [Candidatus Aminicenantes bacterium]|nr:S41 family peptidase [Candidatus Aminicenantes bacterium]
MRQKTVRITLLFLLAIASIFFLFESDILPGLSAQRPSKGILWIVQEVVKHIKEDYVEEPDPSKTMEGAFKGMVNSLDESSSYLTKEAVSKYQQMDSGELNDVGIILYKKYRTFPVVMGVIENSPAEKKGIQLGDTISALDGQSTLTMSMVEANLALKDKTNNPIRIKILRANENEELEVPREKLSEKPCVYVQAEGTSGILSIYNFNSACIQEIRTSILSHLKTSNQTLIIDLRNCHQGNFENMIEFINLFLQSKNIGYFEDNKGKKEVLSTPSNSELAHLPLLIWTNQATMGPAEAAAAILKEYKQAKIIGYPTLGLAAKSAFIPLDDGSGLMLTAAIFHLNTETIIWEEGIEPDIKMEGIDQSSDSFFEQTKKILTHI